MSYTLNKNIRIKRDSEEDKLSQMKVDKWISYILIAVIILVPLLIGGHITEVVSPLIADMDQLISGEKIDMFTFYKFIVLVTLTVIAVVLFLYKLFFLNYYIPKRSILWFFAIFMVAIVISTMLSPSKTIALYGQYNRTDGGISYICYVLLMFVAMHINYSKKIVEHVLYAFYPLVIINFILITMNFTGHDATHYSAVKTVLTFFAPEVVFNDGSNLLGTLNHWNYMSGMFAIVTVMYLAWIVIDTNKLRRVINFIIALLSVTTMLIAMSSSGFLTLICITPLILWLVFKVQHKKIAFLFFATFYICTAIILNVLSMQNPKVWDESVGFFYSGNPYTIEQPVSSIDKQNNIDIKSLFSTSVYAADSSFVLPVLPEPGVGAGSGRFFIWEKTLKLTMERPLFGYGLDTLMYNFPQGSLELRANLETGTVIIDKPHNVYIGVIYGTGIIGFIGFIGLVILSVLVSLKGILRFQVVSNHIVVAFCIAWLAYLFQSLFNDTLPGTAAPLWIVAGIMMSKLYKQSLPE